MRALLFGVMLPSDVSCQIMRPYIGTVTKLSVIHVFKLVFHQYLSFDILHDYLSTTCFALDDLAPPARKGPKI